MDLEPAVITRTPCRYSEGPILRSPIDLDIEGLVSEEVLHVPTARVVLADYDVLQHDFPALATDTLLSMNPLIRDLPVEERSATVRCIIDEWLIANAAYISTSQASQDVANTPIATDGRRTVAYRPPKYGRAVVVPLDDTVCESRNHRWRWRAASGLLDLKGAGVAPDRIPANGIQTNGLEYLGLALSDFLVKKAIDEVFAHALPTVWTVPVYAVLDLGFDITSGYHGWGHAGMHVRRAHRRRLTSPVNAIENNVTYEIELALRRYGITAATRDLQLRVERSGANITWQTGATAPAAITDPHRIGTSLALLRHGNTVTLDRRDVQLAREVKWPPAEAQMVDFGAIRVESRFDCPLIRDYEGSAIHDVVWPDHPAFVQPDPHLQLPVDVWNRYSLKALCFNVASEFRQRRISSDLVRRKLDDHLLAWLNRLPHSSRDSTGRRTDDPGGALANS